MSEHSWTELVKYIKLETSNDSWKEGISLEILGWKFRIVTKMTYSLTIE